MIRDFLYGLHPYDQMSEAALNTLADKIVIKNYAADEQIYSLGDRLDGLYLVRSGKVEIYDAIGEVISLLGRGNSFGERGLLSEGDAKTSARASEACELWLLPRDVFHQYIKKEASFRKFFDRHAKMKRRARTKAMDYSLLPISEIMSAPPIIASPELTVKEAAKLMSEKRISCLPICDEGELIGIITLRDIVYNAIALNDFSQNIENFMTKSPYPVHAHELGVEAIILMAQHHISHLPVVDSQNQIVGVISKSNVVEKDANSVFVAVLEISRAQNVKMMQASIAKLPIILSKLVGMGIEGHHITRLITDLADAATRRLIALYEEENGKARYPFVWAACGSQGRQEQTGVSDQDNVIIYSNEVKDASWYHGLAKYVSDGLDVLGYYYCPGDMMATNEKWCQPLLVWQEYFRGWITKPTEEAQMLASVMFDLRAIAGDATLLSELHDKALDWAEQQSIFIAFMISNSLKHQPPLSLFRGFSTIRNGEHKDRVDLKHNGVVPITDLARVYAMKGEISAVNTRARIIEATKLGIISSQGGEDLLVAYEYILEIRLRHQSRQIRDGKAPDNYLDPSSLSELERSHLRDAFVVVRTMQNALSKQSA